MSEILLNRIIQPFRLTSGLGSYEDRRGCIMAAAGFLAGQNNADNWSDELECVCPVIRCACIAINDNPMWDSDQERGEALMPLVFDIVNTKAIPEVKAKRSFLFADVALRFLIPNHLDAIQDTASATLSVRFRKLDKIKDKHTATTGIKKIWSCGVIKKIASQCQDKRFLSDLQLCIGYLDSFLQGYTQHQELIVSRTCNLIGTNKTNKRLLYYMVRVLKQACQIGKPKKASKAFDSPVDQEEFEKIFCGTR